MKVLRIRLKDFAGVKASEVHFAPVGVTLVVGPNEVGKSTLMTALSVLFDYPDDSKHAKVKGVKPLHADVGAEVEVDLQVDGHELTYRKRFHRDRETYLQIRQPAAEQLTGREAHDRMTQILESSIDVALWKAIRITQDDEYQSPQPELKGQPAIARALDRAAGQARAGDTEEALFEAIAAEHGRYYTDKGKEKDVPLGQAHVAVEQHQANTVRLRTELSALDSQIQRHATLSRESAAWIGRLPELRTRLNDANAKLDALSRLDQEAALLRDREKAAAGALQSTRAASHARTDLVDRSGKAAAKLERSEGTARDNANAMKTAEGKLDGAREARDLADGAAATAELDASVRKQDHEHARHQFDLAQMQERLHRIEEAHAAAAAARDLLATSRMTKPRREAIRTAELELHKAEALVGTDAPRLTITAVKALSLSIGGKTVKLQAGGSTSAAAPEAVIATIPGVLEIEVQPGAGADSLRSTLDSAHQELQGACRAAGVETPADVEPAWNARVDAERKQADTKKVEKENLRDLTLDELRERIAHTGAKVKAYPTTRKSSLAVASSLEQAQDLERKADAAARTARAAKHAADEAFSQLSDQYRNCKEEHSVASALLEQDRSDAQALATRLQAERAATADDQLAEAAAAAERAHAEAERVAKESEARVRQADPDLVEQAVKSADAAMVKAQGESERIQRELIELTAQLDGLGEKGMADQLAEADRLLHEAEDRLARELRRALSAKRLYETMDVARTAARRAYVAPLREGIQRLGRQVFGPSLAVDVSEDLVVTSRTLNDITVPFAQLSKGAREQLGLLVRLAASAIVSKEGGVPLILDDTLGSTDADRLTMMGGVLSVASRDSQTIVLTCAAERYMHVDTAKTVRLAPC